MAVQNATPNSKPSFVSDFSDCNTTDFDYIVIGSSFCAIGFIEKALQKNPAAKILIVEKGRYPSNVQNLSPKDLGEQEKCTEKILWEFKTEDKDGLIENVRGINCCFGGRSCFWKAWCPKPTREEMAGWPEKVVDNILAYFSNAERLLNVTPVNEIKTNEEKPFNLLQRIIHDQVMRLPEKMRIITRIEHASLAVVEKTSRYGSHQKYSVVEPLEVKVKKTENLKLVTECEVTKIITNADCKPSCLETSRGKISLGQAKLILAVSTLPSTILMLKSFPHLAVGGIGGRFTAHFASYIFARVPCEGVYARFTDGQLHAPGLPQLAALYIAGESEKSKHQFHIQLNAVAIGSVKPNLDKMRHLLKTPKEDMVQTCCNHIIFVCASLGQVDHDNQNNKFYLDDKTGEPTLLFTANETDKELWETMDEATFQVLERLSPSNEIDFWNSEVESWQKDRPPKHQIQHRYLVHPASTMWIGDSDTAPVGLDYKIRGVDNVYLTGGALWPTGASWNPTCAMTALAMHLADSLCGQQTHLSSHL